MRKIHATQYYRESSMNIRYITIILSVIFFIATASITCVPTIITPNIIPEKNLEKSELPLAELSLDQLCSLSITNTWREFQLKATNPYHQEKWAWMWSLTLKSKKAVKLRQLNLQWQGEKINSIFASLYQKRENDKQLIPIEKNLVCDGTWNIKKQQLTFNLNEKIIATNKYYLVLSFPQTLETTIKNGTFALPKNNSLKISRLP